MAQTLARVPRVIKNYNLYVDGRGFAGLVDTVTLPDFTLVTEDHRAGGMDGSIPLDLGMEPLEMSFALAEHDPETFKLFGLQNQAAVSLAFRAAMADDLTVVPYKINVQGMYSALSLGEVGLGQKNPITPTVKLRYIRIEQGSEVLLDIDILNMKRIVGGVDQLALQRDALAM